MSRLKSAAGRVSPGWSFGHWPLRRKLAAALALPVILAFVFGGLRVKTDFDAARSLTRAADTVLVLRPIVDYNLAVQHLAAADAIGGGGEIAAITKYESAAANLRIAIKSPSVPEDVKNQAESALALGQSVRSAKTQQSFSGVIIDKSGSTATLLSTAVTDLGTQYGIQPTEAEKVGDELAQQIGDPLTGNMICAGVKAGGRDSCYGDSGGPLIAMVEGKPVQLGIVSWGEGPADAEIKCGHADVYGVYSRVASFKDWIAETMDNKNSVSK